MRRRKVDKEKTSKIDFTDQMGDTWQEYKVFHKPFLDWKQITKKENIEESPYFGATANEINWKMSVKQQAAAQKWVCNAISRTVNLPKDISIKEINDVYWEGWKAGCKGITVYRDGCRERRSFKE